MIRDPQKSFQEPLIAAADSDLDPDARSEMVADTRQKHHQSGTVDAYSDGRDNRVEGGGDEGPSPRSKIVATDLGCIYQAKNGTVEALKDFNLTIFDQEFVSLVGPSGCGKSTFMRIIDDLQRPTSGTIDISRSSKRRPLSATVFQEYTIFPWRTVEANVRLGLEAANVDKDEIRERTALWIERVGLRGFENSYPSGLSGGMKQRVALARAFVMEAEILLMDEPFAALDAQMRKILQDELLSLYEEQHGTVLFVTHSLEEAVLLSDRVVLMSARPGRVRATYDIPFERPRDPSIRKSPEFASLSEEIWETLREEVDRSRTTEEVGRP